MADSDGVAVDGSRMAADGGRRQQLVVLQLGSRCPAGMQQAAQAVRW